MAPSHPKQFSMQLMWLEWDGSAPHRHCAKRENIHSEHESEASVKRERVLEIFKRISSFLHGAVFTMNQKHGPSTWQQSRNKI